MEVARTILRQLGGSKFVAMTGAKHMAAHKDGLSFRLPGGTFSRHINYVKITLTPADLYHIEYGCIRKLKYRVLETEDEVYAEDLQRVFTQTTGLDTRLW